MTLGRMADFAFDFGRLLRGTFGPFDYLLSFLDFNLDRDLDYPPLPLDTLPDFLIDRDLDCPLSLFLDSRLVALVGEVTVALRYPEAAALTLTPARSVATVPRSVLSPEAS